MKNKTQKWVRFRHKVYIAILKYPVMFIFWLLYGFKHKKIKLAKNENAFIISNHQTQFDPILVSLGVNKPVYYVATDTLFSNKFVSSLLNHLFAPIPKKKGLTDPKCIKTMMKRKIFTVAEKKRQDYRKKRIATYFSPETMQTRK